MRDARRHAAAPQRGVVRVDGGSLVGPAGFEPATKGLCLPLRLSPQNALGERVVCGLDYAFTMPTRVSAKVGDYSLYTFGSPEWAFRLARRWEIKPFAEFTPD